MLALAVAVPGCDTRPPMFRSNLVYVRNQRLARDLADFKRPEVKTQVADIEGVVARLFGTPDQPALPASGRFDWDKLLDIDKLRQAAGPIAGSPSGNPTGLFRRYCVRCHGYAGDGSGPMAPFLDPYPHDFRRGIFKFKSTPSTIPPTRKDLQAVIDRGIPGTGMPTFKQLSPEQRDALVQYVVYLTIRGLYERELITIVALEFDEGERLVRWRLEEQSPDRFEEELKPWLEVAEQVAQKWTDVESEVTPVPPPAGDWESAANIARGRQLFFSSLTNCAQCHGNTSLGDGQTDDYDEWAKELDPTNPHAVRDYVALGALPPRKVHPRNLREGIFRGGDGLDDEFRRIRNGIAGTTMPSVATELSDTDIWCLVSFVRRLPKDAINQ